VKVCWSRRALADLARIADRIARGKPLAATEFVRAVQGKVERLALFPLLGHTGVYQDTRELVVHKNYLVTYRVRADEVQVLQVWHVARSRKAG
jgi:toxin ParE1/3/4